MISRAACRHLTQYKHRHSPRQKRGGRGEGGLDDTGIGPGLDLCQCIVCTPERGGIPHSSSSCHLFQECMDDALAVVRDEDQDGAIEDDKAVTVTMPAARNAGTK